MLAFVIPYYKISFFETTLQSLASQSDMRFSVYIGDDASPENPAELIAKFSDKLHLKYKRFDENYGGQSLTRQWERCLEMTGEEDWVLILGDDDFLSENVVSEFYKNIEKAIASNCNVIRYATRKKDDKTQTDSAVFSHPEIEKSTTFLTRLYTLKTRSSLSEYVFNKKLLLQKGIPDYPVAWHSDLATVLKVSDFKEVFSINEAVMWITISNESISGSKEYIRQKAKADYEFGKFLIENLHRFPKEEREIVLSRIEKMAVNNRKLWAFAIKIIALHLSRLDFARTFSFIYKICKK